MDNKKQSKIGEIFYNNQGCRFEIVDYKKSNEVYIKFDNCSKPIKTTYAVCKSGSINNPMHPSLLRRGYVGEGKYKAVINAKHTHCYITWKSMMYRCYDEKLHNRNETYRECEVCEEWHNYQNFAEWYENNYYKVGKETMCLDKDILVKKNKVYSPETCVFVPQRINKSILHKRRSGELPLGIRYNTNKTKFKVECKDFNHKNQYVGTFDKLEEAMLAYNTYKQTILIEIAEFYKEYIPENLYKALCNYMSR